MKWNEYAAWKNEKRYDDDECDCDYDYEYDDYGYTGRESRQDFKSWELEFIIISRNS